MKNRFFFAFVITGCIALAMAFFGSSTQTTVQDYPNNSIHYTVPDGVAVAAVPFHDGNENEYVPYSYYGVVYDEHFEAPKGYYNIKNGIRGYQWHEDKRERIRNNARSNC